jgi:hypothetical protein
MATIIGGEAVSGALYAHYCNDKTLRITNSARPVGGTVYSVAGKREARALAASLNAKCWNF